MSYQREVYAQAHSLAEVHGSVGTSHPSFWRRLFAFAGPAYLVSVGYMDPGNWATDLEGGARFGYSLLWVLVMSNAMALLLQTLSSRLGIIARRDLAQACRDEYPKLTAYTLWILCEVAIIACDLAEVLGAAIGINLLFKIPLLLGVLITAADTLLILWFTRYGIRAIEAFVLVLILTISACFGVEIFLAKPQASEVFSGLLPHLNSSSLYVAVAMLGATVMPHNLYLHSALVQTRRIGDTPLERREACRFNFIDSFIALNGALFVNAAILVMAGAVFFQNHIVVTEIQQAHALLSPLLGNTFASLLFGAALLCSGLSSTLTGTMAGQIVMEGFLRFKMQPWLRRSITRMLAILPAALTIYYAGERASYSLLLLSQVVLSIQLPFAVIPLLTFTSDKQRMGEAANNGVTKIFAWLTAALILALNIQLAWDAVSSWLSTNGPYRTLVLAAVTIVGCILLWTLGTLLAWPFVRHRVRHQARIAVPAAPTALPAPRTYSSILVTLDHSDVDSEAVANALTLAKSSNAVLILLHVEEGVASRIYGSMASTAEVAEGRDYFEQIAESLRHEGIAVEIVVVHGKSPAQEIAKVVRQKQPDLLVMAAHGHRGLKDIIFGSTINNVRHHVNVPILIVRPRIA